MPQDNNDSKLLQIATALPVLGPVIGAFAQGSQNRKNRRFTRQMYALQREHALADWHMQNEYNHPSQQMARLRDAGLNPNLVYGNGVEGNAGGAVRSSTVNEMNQRAPEWGAVGAGAAQSLSAYQDIKLKEAQIDNLRHDNTVKANQAELMATDKLKRLMEIKTGNLDYDIKESLRNYQVEYADLQNKKMAAETSTMLDRNEREIAMNNVSIKKAYEEILNYRLQRAYTAAQTAKTWTDIKKINEEIKQIQWQIKGMHVDRQLKLKDLEWRRDGLTPNDPAWYRALHDLLKGKGKQMKLPEVVLPQRGRGN